MEANRRLLWSSCRMSEPVRLPGQERGELVVVQHVVGLVPRHALLQEPEAERVDGADEQPGQPVQRRRCRAGPPPGGRSGCFSSSAARSVKVNATIDSAGSPSASRSATRCETTSVLPDPAEAMI